MIPTLNSDLGTRNQERSESGQALVEFALMAPLLVLMLCGVVYCGGLVAAQQNLAIGARAAARAMAIDATRAYLKNPAAGGRANKGVGQQALDAALPGRGATLAGVTFSALGAGTQGSGHAGSWTKTGRIAIPGLGQKACGVGVALYGATARRDLARDLSPIGRLSARLTPGGGLSNMLAPSLSASSVMPAELPLRGGGTVKGVLDLNPWISAVVKRKPTARLD